MTISQEQITELTLDDAKITALVTDEKVYKINVYQLCESLAIVRYRADKFLYDHCSHVPKEDRHFVEPSVAAVFLLQIASGWHSSKSHAIIIKLLTEFLTPQQQQ
ncbi:MAG: hypothetical protein V7K67_21495 [Nostoc sp.]|uniref:hypothetical protein n=1 Tax=Nostoc sp. TaxID=1180 RepID=UPI002FF59A45